MILYHRLILQFTINIALFVTLLSKKFSLESMTFSSGNRLLGQSTVMTANQLYAIAWFHASDGDQFTLWNPTCVTLAASNTSAHTLCPIIMSSIDQSDC